jgi:uncharacterized protein
MPPPARDAGFAPMPPRAGIGLRFCHHREVLERPADLAWLEVHSENYLGGGTPVADLDALRRRFPVSLHGVGLSLGNVEGLHPEHLERIGALVDRLAPALVSEHLAWSSVGNAYLADLLPLPLTEEALAVVCGNVDRLQARLRRTILVENPATCLTWSHSTIPECEFLSAVAARTGCGLLCDVNNLYVSASNHRFDPSAYLAALPPAAVGEYHLAGHAVRHLEDGSVVLIDDHGSKVCDAVWSLYIEALARIGPRPTLIEWDTDVPPLLTLLAQAKRADDALACAAPEPAHDLAA